MRENTRYFKKLALYGSSAAAFLLNNTNVQGQVVYENIDPDMIIYDDHEPSLDLNHDGFNDVSFKVFSHTTWTYYSGHSHIELFSVNFYLKSFYGIVSNPDMASSINIALLHEGDIVGPDSPWATGDQINFPPIIPTTSAYYMGDDAWLSHNNFIGIKFLIDGNTHYGWMRLSFDNVYPLDFFMPYLFIQDYAYEATAETAILIQPPTAGIAENLVFEDVAENNDPTDLKLTFNKADDESGIAEYRVFLFKSYWYTDVELDELLSLPSEQYISISPDGNNQSLYFNNTFLDIDNEPILPDVGYRAVVVSVTNDPLNFRSNISIKSNSASIRFVNAETAINITVNNTDHVNCNLSDYKVNFDCPKNDFGVAAYRVFVMPLDSSIFPLSELLVYDETYYTKVLPTGAGSYTVNLNSNQNLVSSNSLNIFNNYNVLVLSIPDSIAASNLSMNGSDLPLYYYCETVSVKPEVAIASNTLTAKDIQVQFPKVFDEAVLELYEVYLIPADEIDAFTINDVTLLKPYQKISIIPSGSDINVHLPEFLQDIDGNLLIPDKEYVIKVGLIGKEIYDNIALSLPSDNFKLTDGSNAGPFVYDINENELTIIFYNPGNYTLNIFNITGQLINTYNLTDALVKINLAYLTPGTYIAQIVEMTENNSFKLLIPSNK